MTDDFKPYRAITDNIIVAVVPYFLDELSDAEKQQFVWSYEITITNLREENVRLRSRYWLITDELGRREEVEGVGVVGEEPLIRPQSSYRYVSGCPLQTASGIMVGHYVMETENGDRFQVKIPAFSLDSPIDKDKQTVN